MRVPRSLIRAIAAATALGAAAAAVALFFSRERSSDAPAGAPSRFPLVAVIDTGFSWDRWPADAKPPGDSDRARVVLDDPASRDLTIPEDQVALPGDPEPLADTHGHGTRIAAEIMKHAPRASVLPVRVTRQGFFGTPELLAQAVEAALDAGADVINVSFGVRDDKGPGSAAVTAQLERAAREGVTVVAAAGVGIENPFRPGPLSGLLPQSHAGVIVVGTVFESGGAVHPSRDENYGPETDLSVRVGDGRGSRSSTAAARVSAAVARILGAAGARPGSIAVLRHQLRAGTQALPGYLVAAEGNAREPRAGFGRLEESGASSASEPVCRAAGDASSATVVTVSAPWPIRGLSLGWECPGGKGGAPVRGAGSFSKGSASGRLGTAPSPGCRPAATLERASGGSVSCRP